ncbi:uncharacterized protein LOC129722346 isoform X2 [Wyeomyia smithii]|nr:uncharacterized protein LOC129722346 isoform X2 [Wyeomyia smithii]
MNVGNLPWDVTEQQLRDHFSGYDIENVEIFHYRKYTLATFLFKDKETAAKALAGKEGSILRERRLRMHLEYINIRHIPRDTFVIVVDDENATEEQLWDKVKSAGVEPYSILLFYPLCYICPEKDSDKADILEKLKAAGFNAHDVNQRDQNQHLDIWREAKLFFRNRNRVQLLNIPHKWIEDKEEMKKQCANGGTIIEAILNNMTRNASNYARIFYESEEQAVKAAEALNGRFFEDKRIHALHLGSALIPNYKTSVYVTSLDKTTTEEQVYDHFKQFGDIDFVNRRNCIDAAIVCFKSADSVEKALLCTSFPAATEENKDATKEVSVKKYDGPLVLRQQAQKRKLKTNEDGKSIEPEEKTKAQLAAHKKLEAFYPVFVGNVPFNCPPLDLKRYFAQHGPIKFMFSPQILPYRTSAPHPVKTFIIYYNFADSADNACQFLDHKFFGGHRLHVLPLRGEEFFNEEKTLKLTKIPYLSEDALFKKIKPFVGKINRIVKKSRLVAYIELNDPADAEKLLNVETPNHPFPKSNVERIDETVSMRLYDEDDSRVLNGIAMIISQNPDMLKKTPMNQGGPMNKRPRLNGPGFNQGPGGFNPNNSLTNPQAIQDLLRLAFMSGKNVGESLASNQTSFNNPDPPIANLNNFGDGGFGNRNRNNQGGPGNFRSQGRNMNQNQNRGNANNSFGNNNASVNFQNALGVNQNRGGQNMTNRGNQPMNQTHGASVDGGNNSQNRTVQNLNQGNRVHQKKPGVGNNINQNRNQGGGNLNRNQNQNRIQNNRNNNFVNDTYGGSNNFGNNRNNFTSDNFSDNFGNNRNNDNFSSDNFSGNNRNFGSNRKQNDNLNSFGGENNSGNNRFGGSNQFSVNFSRNQNSNFDDNNSNGNFVGNKGNNFNQNRQNKPFNAGNQGGGMSFNEFNTNTSRNFGSGNSNNSGSFNPQNSNTGSRLAGSIFSRRF